MGKIKACVICGQDFSSKSNRQITCSKKCGKERKRQVDKSRKSDKHKNSSDGIKICAVCGKDFISKHPNEKTCSDKCREKRNKQTNKASKQNWKLICEHCGEHFIGVYATRYCSDECRSKAIKKIYAKKEVKNTCISCGKEFIGNRAGMKYCSDKCKYEYRENHPIHTNICEQCGKSYKTNNKNQKFCSRECVEEASRIYPNEHICKNCGNKFHRPYNPGRDECIYCSKDCEYEYKKNNTGRYCEVCGKELVANLFDYCSEECRAIDRTKICPTCGNRFVANNSMTQVYCSDNCRYISCLEDLAQRRKIDFIPEEKTCKNCGKKFMTEFKGSKTFCSDECTEERDKINKKRHRKNARYKRRMKKELNGEVDNDISLKELYKNSKGVCALCGREVSYKDYSITEEGYFVVGKSYPSIDHIIPLAKGGTHTWDNIQLAHHYCNSIKSDYLIEQNQASI